MLLLLLLWLITYWWLFGRRRRAIGRQLDDPRRRNDGFPVGAERAWLGEGGKGVAVLLVVVGNLAPGARDRLDFLRKLNRK